MKKYLCIDNKCFKITKEYTTPDGDYIIKYKDKDTLKDTVINFFVFFIDKEIINNCKQCTCSRINWFNPITYIVLICGFFRYLLTYGVYNFIEDFKKEIKPCRHNINWVRKENIKIIEK